MKLFDINELPQEMNDRIDSMIGQLAVVTEAIRIAEDERKRLRDELVDALQTVGAEPGDVLEAAHHGVRVEMTQRIQRQLRRDSLLELGVSQDLIDMATTQSETAPYVVLRRMDTEGCPQSNILHGASAVSVSDLLQWSLSLRRLKGRRVQLEAQTVGQAGQVVEYAHDVGDLQTRLIVESQVSERLPIVLGHAGGRSAHLVGQFAKLEVSVSRGHGVAPTPIDQGLDDCRVSVLDTQKLCVGCGSIVAILSSSSDGGEHLPFLTAQASRTARDLAVQGVEGRAEGRMG